MAGWTHRMGVIVCHLPRANSRKGIRPRLVDRQLLGATTGHRILSWLSAMSRPKTKNPCPVRVPMPRRSTVPNRGQQAVCLMDVGQENQAVAHIQEPLTACVLTSQPPHNEIVGWLEVRHAHTPISPQVSCG